ncbi:hypothetical protein FOCC_FOCC016055 [Frankliniella occidentalis]|nr:hypothetical protein FOCC_FOCC016055 [Frankliniella occidentalis]
MEFKSACVNVMAMDLRPTTTFSGDEFTKLIQTACNVQARHGKQPINAAQLISDRTTLVRCLEEEADKARQEISADLNSASEDSVGMGATTDLWTEKYSLRHYMSLTMHIIDHNHKLLNLVLSVSNFQDDSETAENLAEHLDRELRKFNVIRDNLVFVTDGGKNVINALEILNIPRIYCMDHCLNIVLKTAFNMKMVELDLYGETGREVLKCVESAVNFVRSSRRRKSENLKKLKKPPRTCEATEFPRYMSHVPCMQDLLDNFDEVCTFLHNANEEETANNLSRDDIQVLVDFIQPLDEKAKPHSNDLSEVNQAWLNDHIEDKPEDGDLLCFLKANARVQLAGRFAVQLMQKCKKIVTLFKGWGENHLLDETLKQDIPTRWNSLLIMLMSFPKDHFDTEDQNDIKRLINFLKPWKLESERVQGDKYPTLQYVLVFDQAIRMCDKFSGSTADHTTARKRRKLDDGYDQWRAESSTAESGEEYDEIEEYLNAKLPLVPGEDVLKFWEREAHRFPKLAKLAKQVLCIPASSASSERAFSIAGLIISPRRNLLSSDHLDDMLVLRGYLRYKKEKETDGAVAGAGLGAQRRGGAREEAVGRNRNGRRRGAGGEKMHFTQPTTGNSVGGKQLTIKEEVETISEALGQGKKSN